MQTILHSPVNEDHLKAMGFVSRIVKDQRFQDVVWTRDKLSISRFAGAWLVFVSGFEDGEGIETVAQLLARFKQRRGIDLIEVD